MTRLITATGQELLCDSVTRGQAYPYLYIHTAALSWAEAQALFTDPAELTVLTAVERFTFPAQTDKGEETVEAEQTKTYRGWTELYCIQRSPLFDDPAELMIWLRRPEEED